MNKIIYLTGPPAVGKSTINLELKKKRSDIKFFEYGKEMSKYLTQKSTRSKISQSELKSGVEGYVTSFDIQHVNKRMIKFIQDWKDSYHIIIDSHQVTKEDYGFKSTLFSKDELHQAKFTSIFFLYCEPSSIIQRISNKSDGRPTISEFEALLHNEYQSSIIPLYCFELGISAYYLDSGGSKFSHVHHIERYLNS